MTQQTPTVEQTPVRPVELKDSELDLIVAGFSASGGGGFNLRKT